MPRSSLDSLLRLRRQELDEARRILSDAIAQAMSAAEAVKTAEQDMVTERDAALDLSADDRTVEAYSRWLPRGRAALDQARRQEQNAATAVQAGRTRVTMARAALEATEKLIESRAQEERARQEKQEQNVIDDLSARRVPEF